MAHFTRLWIFLLFSEGTGRWEIPRSEEVRLSELSRYLALIMPSPSRYAIVFWSLCSCLTSKHAFTESLTTLRNLKHLRWIAYDLFHSIDVGIAQVEKEVLPAARYRGIRALPREILVSIMDMVGNVFATDPENLRTAMETFLCVEPFSDCFKDAKLLLRLWKK